MDLLLIDSQDPQTKAKIAYLQTKPRKGTLVDAEASQDDVTRAASPFYAQALINPVSTFKSDDQWEQYD
ncbi:MAG: hypothetical protein EON54_04400 [Alcaligenaceae bacterium]|nr:MAG: hypothetical protein EON54_04400 [Alcaligenaceae bacterium]